MKLSRIIEEITAPIQNTTYPTIQEENVRAYNPDLALSNFLLFTKLKDFLGETKFQSDKELKDSVANFCWWTDGRGICS